MEYLIDLSQLPDKPFSQLTKRETEIFFEKYMEKRNERIKYLECYINEEQSVNLDYSLNSLISLWKWFEDKIETVKLSEEEFETKKTKYPDWIAPFLTQEKIAVQTQFIGMDIAIYFAEVFIKNNPSIQWGYFTKPKNRRSVNQPVLLGFVNGVDMDPRGIVNTCTRKSSKEKNENRLFNIYNVWLKYIEN